MNLGFTFKRLVNTWGKYTCIELPTRLNTPNCQHLNLLSLSALSPYFVFTRNTSFFNKVSAEQLWKGVTSVSNAGRKRGRGKGAGRKAIKDLNRGQIIGVGKINMVWPGLNAPVIQGKEVVQQTQLPPDPDREAKLIKMRDSMGQFRALKLNPIERGWSGAKMHGRSSGPPEPIGQDTFDGFDSRIIEMKVVTNMDATLGRRRRFSVATFTGNGQGICGFALAKAPEGKGAIRKSKNRAGQKLVYIERYNNHTVLHDFYTAYGSTKIFVCKKPEGFGLVCHRAIRTMCQLIGIKDLYAKIEGSTNVQHIVKAFLLGLLRQRSYQDLSNEKKLHLIEMKQENFNFPSLLASPPECRKSKEIPSSEDLEFNHVVMDYKIPLKRRPYVPFYFKLPSYRNYLLKTEWRRNHDNVLHHLYAEHGGLKSHLTSQYPECDGSYGLQLSNKKKMLEAQQEEE